MSIFWCIVASFLSPKIHETSILARLDFYEHFLSNAIKKQNSIKDVCGKQFYN